ncbi:MAG: efflux RND transporter periplasmic adaptor subunit [Bacteroidaceae bacterium]|nr:efflux RND transporter periplasmic adaptor subunit [Bacteroidaceae bacterium]
MKYTDILGTACVGLALLLTGGCASHPHEHEEEATDEHGHKHSADAIIMEPASAKAAGVTVSKVERTTFHDVIATSGKVIEASCDESNLVATVPGIVTHTRHISEGTAVQRGAVIYHINSANLQDGDVTQHSLIAYEKAKKDMERADALLADKLITERDYNALRMDYEKARLAYEAIGSKRGAQGVSITVPETGYVKECFVKDGDYVEVGQRLMTITRNQHLYLRAELPMRYYTQLDRIRTAKFKTALSEQLYDLSDMDGELLSAGKSISSTYSYIPITFEFNNHGGLVPGSYAEVYLIAGDRPDVLCVPASALTEEQGLYFVYIKEGAHAYRKQEVALGATDGERVEIKSGLKGGEEVVVTGAISVKLAGASKAVPGHTHNH